ncbi:hypothetical protein BY996DRAFT_4589576 [Phakopsora pachyrhizi]|nr:hypothetical protein BY996DRAFT_4589576 [Phakopsora pachyrhizi]
MLFPKFAAHISSFKLSYFAHRGHQHFQQFRNTFNNVNLGSNISQNSHSVGNSATGLGSAGGSSTAGGAGGAKWSAGSRAGWNQQTQGRLLTQTNATAQDGSGNKQADDEEHEDLSNQSLNTVGLYNKRNGSISSRWRYNSTSLTSVSALGLDNTSLQLRYRLNFPSLKKVKPSTLLNHTVEGHTLNSETNVSSQELDLPSQAEPSRIYPQVTYDDISGTYWSDRPRRSSTSDCRPVIRSSSSQGVIQCAPLSRRRYSTPASGANLESRIELSENTYHMAQSSTELFRDQNPSSNEVQPSSENSKSEQWLEKVVKLLNSKEEHHFNIYYQLRKLLDYYLSSSLTPEASVIDLIFWGSAVYKPSHEPIDGLLGCHQFLISRTGFKPTEQTYSILITSLCRRDLSNTTELEYRRNKLNQISTALKLHQILPGLYYPPNPTAEDLKLITRLSNEPNLKYLADLFKSLDPSIKLRLQPVALDSVIQICANIDLSNVPPAPAEVTFRLNLALEAFKILEDLNACSSQSYSNLIKLLGLSKKIPRAKVLFETYKQLKAENEASVESARKFYHEHYLQPPNPGLTPPRGSSNLHDFSIPRQVDEDSDSAVSLSLIQAYLVNGDSVSAVTLLEEILASGPELGSTDRTHSDHILEIILGFIRAGDFGSASKWIKRLFNGDHASYDLDKPSKRRPFLDRIVYLACEPKRIIEGLSVAYDTVMVSIDQIDSKLDRRGLGSLLARLRHVVNCLLVESLTSSASLASSRSDLSKISRIQDTLYKSCSILCYILTKRLDVSEASPSNFSAVLDVSTHWTIENILKRALLSYRETKNQWITSSSTEFKQLGEFSESLIIKLMQHYSKLPKVWHSSPSGDSSEARLEPPALTGLLTCYQSLLLLPCAEISGQSVKSFTTRHLEFILRITTAPILNNLSLSLATQIHQLFVDCDKDTICFQSIDDCLALLTAGAILEIQFRESQLLRSSLSDITIPSGEILEPLLAQCEKPLSSNNSDLQDYNPEADYNFLASVISKYNIKLNPGSKLGKFFHELRATESNNRSTDRIDSYAEEGSKFFQNRFGNLREGELDAFETKTLESHSPSKVSAFSPTQAHSPIFSTSTGHVTTSSPLSPPSSQIESPPKTLNAFAPSFHPQSLSTTAPVRSINEKLSHLALSMFCSKDLQELDKLYESVHRSATVGDYLIPDASSSLVETFGRLGQPQRMREMYVNAHIALSFLSNRSASDRAQNSTSWTRVEDRMIIGLAYCGILDEISVHKNRLIENGGAPSADAYAAMIQHARETTDDASVALNYFEEAIQFRVTPNTFLCNTIISKLSKARRATEALQVFDYMKQYNLPRNSVTFGAIINACCKTADYKMAESLFEEMLSSKNYKPRIPPFNTMIQLYVQGLRTPNRERALYYYDMMVKQRLSPSEHTYGMIEPYNLGAVQNVFEAACSDRKIAVGGSHWSTLINVKGLIEKDLEGTLKLFDSIKFHPSRSTPKARQILAELPDALCYESLFNVLASFKRSDLIEGYVKQMSREGIHMTAYVVNTLIKAHASSGDIDSARRLFESLVDPPPGHAAAFNHPSGYTGEGNAGKSNQVAGKVGDPIYREPSCYETMIQVEVENQDFERANDLIQRMESRAYPEALLNKARKIINNA